MFSASNRTAMRASAMSQPHEFSARRLSARDEHSARHLPKILTIDQRLVRQITLPLG
jgi:hypothetical protein